MGEPDVFTQAVYNLFLLRQLFQHEHSMDQKRQGKLNWDTFYTDESKERDQQLRDLAHVNGLVFARGQAIHSVQRYIEAFAPWAPEPNMVRNPAYNAERDFGRSDIMQSIIEPIETYAPRLLIETKLAVERNKLEGASHA